MIYKQNVKHFANIRKKLLTRLLIQMKFKKCESKKKKMTDSYFIEIYQNIIL